MRTSRSMSDWLRRDRLTNIALKLLRSMASLPASRTASAWTWSNARATWPISSADSTSIGSTCRLIDESGASPSWRTRSGSSTVAMLSAPSRSLRSGPTRDRATAIVANSTRSRMIAVSSAVISAVCSAFRCSDRARATMFWATTRSTCCMSSTLPDWAVNHCPGAAAGLMPRAPWSMFRVPVPGGRPRT